MAQLTRILCIGDSHSKYFDLNGYHYRAFGHRAGPRFRAYPLMAASAAGFAKGKESRFAYRSAVKVASEVDFDQICFGFGQVDAEAGVYYGRYVLNRSESDEAYFTRIYAAYLDQCDAFSQGKPYVIKGLNPSCLVTEDCVKTHVFNMISRRIHQISERDAVMDNLEGASLTVEAHAARNDLANSILEQLCYERNIRSFNMRKELQDQDIKGLAAEAYVPARSDIHLAPSFFVSKLHYQRLIEVIFY